MNIEDLSSEGYRPVADLSDKTASPIQARAFNRANLSEGAIQLRFQSGQQFAKCYIDNISIGGLFVKSDQKRSVGEVLDVAFSLPAASSGQPFEIFVRARVARVTDEGMGLQFLTLNREVQFRLEQYVQAALPAGAQSRSIMRESSVERLRGLRQEQTERTHFFKRRMIQISVFAVLALANGFLVFGPSSQNSSSKIHHLDRSFVVQGRNISINQVRGIRIDKTGAAKIELEDGSIVSLASSSQLPQELQQGSGQLQSMRAQKTIRRPINMNSVSRTPEKKDGARRRR